MKTQLGHIQVNIDGKNAGFYKALFGFLGWNTLYEGDGFVGLGDDNGASLWFMAGANNHKNDYDGVGTNHIAISASTQAEVDEAAAYLTGKGVVMLFDTPRHRPDFSESETDTYYQVMFESPDRILLEVVYTGPKAA